MPNIAGAFSKRKFSDKLIKTTLFINFAFFNLLNDFPTPLIAYLENI